MPNTAMAEPLNNKVHLKSIIPLSFVPKYNISYENLSFTNGTLYQYASKPEVYRNQLIVIDEQIDLYNLQYIPLGGVKLKDLISTHNHLFFRNFSYSYVLNDRRWAFFIIGDSSNTLPPSEMFGNKDIVWINFGEGFYYVNNSDRAIAIWTWYPEVSNLENIASEIIKVVKSTFPFYEWNYLENNFYLKNYLNFSQKYREKLSRIEEKNLNIYIDELNKNIFDCLKRKNQYYMDYTNLAEATTYFYTLQPAYGIISPLIENVGDITSVTMDQNSRNLENLQEAKSIIQSELAVRIHSSEVQKDYVLTAMSVLLGGLITGIATLGVSLYLQKKERIASGASQQRIDFYEPFYNEVVKINKELTEFKCPFNAKETLKVWENLKPSAKNRVPESIKEKITDFDRLGRTYYELYIRSLDVLRSKIDSVMNRYKVEGITRGEIDREIIELRNTFNSRKQTLLQEYQSDFFTGRLSDIRGRPSLERLCSMLSNKNITRQQIFDRIVSSLTTEQTIIELKETRDRLIIFSREFETNLKNKIDNILDHYEKKLKKI